MSHKSYEIDNSNNAVAYNRTRKLRFPVRAEQYEPTLRGGLMRLDLAAPLGPPHTRAVV